MLVFQKTLCTHYMYDPKKSGFLKPVCLLKFISHLTCIHLVPETFLPTEAYTCKLFIRCLISFAMGPICSCAFMLCSYSIRRTSSSFRVSPSAFSSWLTSVLTRFFTCAFSFQNTNIRYQKRYKTRPRMLYERYRRSLSSHHIKKQCLRSQFSHVFCIRNRFSGHSD